MIWRRIVLLLAVSACLSGCIPVPYVGRDYDDESPCVSVQLVSFLRSNLGSCKHLNEHRKKDLPKDAPESSKHILYTEEQRLAMAKATAHRLYPHARFWMAKNVAEIAVGSEEYRLNMPYHSCNGMLAERTLTLRIENQFSDKELFEQVAQKWSQRYSDEELATIQRTSSADLQKDYLNNHLLAPQWTMAPDNPLVEIPGSGVEEQLVKYRKDHEASLKAMADEEIARAEASHQYDAQALCHISGIDEKSGDYNLVIDRSQPYYTPLVSQPPAP